MEEVAVSDVPVVCEMSKVVSSSAGAALSKNMAYKQSALPFILTAIGGFFVGYLTSKMLEWMNPDPGSGKVPTRHIHDHHHFHHQSSPRHDTAYAKVIG